MVIIQLVEPPNVQSSQLRQYESVRKSRLGNCVADKDLVEMRGEAHLARITNTETFLCFWR